MKAIKFQMQIPSNTTLYLGPIYDQNALEVLSSDINIRTNSNSLYRQQSNAQNAEMIIPIHSLQLVSTYQASHNSLRDHLTNSQEGINKDNCAVFGSYTNAFSVSDYQNVFGSYTSTFSVSDFSGDEDCVQDVKHFNEKASKLKWTAKSTKSLLLFLRRHKEVLKHLVEKRGGSGNIKKELWTRASITVSDDEDKYLPEQCEFKWKNIKQAYKHNPHYRYNSEINAILK
ncbi:17360_t:CDS:2 [Funneliformis geosporum]|uniref:11937_t:CDS:1 n=1 Tax=Funneliformis geosporum TaxID=1117311 RepID=A0A9W4SHU2_9GLOM|nr:17360_t:CDS:2 [Funneliformis geosporum]CAI2169518.1 11937_t:CDS:2 [Funneliformis geosporum]